MLRVAVIGRRREPTEIFPSRNIRFRLVKGKELFALFDIEGVTKDDAPADMKGPVYSKNGFMEKCFTELKNTFPTARKISEIDLDIYKKSGKSRLKKVWYSRGWSKEENGGRLF